jgi:hypothetical protein
MASLLIILGWFLVPATNPRAMAAALGILAVYGFLGYFGAARLHRRNPLIFQVGAILGLLAGAIFFVEILWEYLALPADNTRIGLVEFGSVFTLYLLSAAFAAYRTRRLRQALVTSISTAMIGSLIWLVAVLAISFLFWGSPQQTHVFRAEGNYEDFARSGMTDFNAFILEDFMGAAFFHLLLGPIVAAILGTIGGLLGKGLAQLRNK